MRRILTAEELAFVQEGSVSRVEHVSLVEIGSRTMEQLNFCEHVGCRLGARITLRMSGETELVCDDTTLSSPRPSAQICRSDFIRRLCSLEHVNPLTPVDPPSSMDPMTHSDFSESVHPCGPPERVEQTGESSGFMVDMVVEGESARYDFGDQSLVALAASGYQQSDTLMDDFFFAYNPLTNSTIFTGFGAMDSIPLPLFYGVSFAGEGSCMRQLDSPNMIEVPESHSTRGDSILATETVIEEGHGGRVVSAPDYPTVSDALSSRFHQQLSDLQTVGVDFLRDWEGSLSRLSAAEARVWALELDKARLSSALDEERDARGRDKERFMSERRSLETKVGDAISQGDSAVAARQESVRVQTEIADRLAMELAELRCSVADGQDESYRKGELAGMNKFADNIPRIHAEYMRGFGEALVKTGIPDSNPVWMELNFRYQGLVPSVVPGWGASIRGFLAMATSVSASAAPVPILASSQARS